MQFRTTIEQARKTATGLRVPDEVVEALGGGRQPKVRVTVAGYEYATSIARRGDRYLIPLSGAHRAAAGVQAGDTVDVRVELDTGAREPELPQDLAAALGEDPDARDRFDGLTPTQRGYFVESVTSAKKPETRLRRVEKAIASLRAGRKQP